MCPVHGNRPESLPAANSAPPRNPGPDMQRLADNPELQEILESAARVQSVVKGDITLVGGAAAAAYANHRMSFDHDHVVSNLRVRYEMVVEALEREGDWITARDVPGKIVLGSLGGIESGVRQLIRTRPLETVSIETRGGQQLTLPTEEEILRIKGYLIVKRNQMRDYLDVAALAEHNGLEESAITLAEIDKYYDSGGSGDDVASQLVRQLSDPSPRDSRAIGELSKSYKGIRGNWSDWNYVVGVCKNIADRMSASD